MRCGYSRGYTYIIYIAWFLLVVRLILRIGGFSRFPIICDFFRFPIICDFYDKSVNIVEATSFRQSPIWSEWSDESESFLVWKMHPSGSWIDNRGFLRQMRTCIVNKKYIRLGRKPNHWQSGIALPPIVICSNFYDKCSKKVGMHLMKSSYVYYNPTPSLK